MLYSHIGWHPQLIYIDIPKYKSIKSIHQSIHTVITTWFINFHHHVFAVVVWVCSLKEKFNTNHRGIARGLFTTIGNHSGPLVKPSGLFLRVVVNAESCWDEKIWRKKFSMAFLEKFYSNRKRRRSNSQGSWMFWSWSMFLLIFHSFFGAGKVPARLTFLLWTSVTFRIPIREAMVIVSVP